MSLRALAMAGVVVAADTTYHMIASLRVHLPPAPNRADSGYDVWRWDPEVSRFTKDSVLSSLSNPHREPDRPCVSTWSVGGMVGMIHTDTVRDTLQRRVAPDERNQ